MPGAIFLFFLSKFFPEVLLFYPENKLEIGGLGLFSLLSYFAGHLIHAIGNFLESKFWKFWGGMPTNWVLDEKKDFLNSYQIKILQVKINKFFRNRKQSK